MKVHLVDGTFELFRCFHGAPRARSASGREVGAVRGMLFTLVSLLRQPDTSHVAVAFDQMATDGRQKDDASTLLRSQYAPAAAAIRALGIALWPMVRYQADDALASGAARFKHEPGVEQVVVCTTDKDLAQAVDGDRVVLLDRIRKVVTNEAGVVEKFGVPPRLFAEYLGLVGDRSDGLPGLPGWGRKSAAALLGRYESIEAIPEDSGDWEVTVRGAARLAKSLNARRLETILVRNLATLRTDLPIPHGLDDLEWRGEDRSVLEALIAEVGGEEVLGRLDKLHAARR